MKVKDAMHKGVDWVSPDTPITEIAKLMRAHDIGCIPIGEDDDLAKAIHHMETLKVRRLPVINKNKRMVGMISLGDVSHSTSGDLVSGYVKSVSAHH